MYLKLLTLLLLPSCTFAGSDISGIRGGRKTLDYRITEFDAAEIYRITLSEELVRQEDGTFESVGHTMSIPIIGGAETSDFYSIELPQYIIDDYSDEIEKGNLFISIAGTDKHGESITVEDDAAIEVLDMDPLTRRQLAGAVGERSIAALRVSMSDGPVEMREVGYSKQEMEHQLFESEMSFTNQFNKCSGGDLRVIPAGVFEVTVPGKWSDWPAAAHLRNEALKLLAQKYNVASGKDLADHVAVILPPNEWSGFVGNAGLNHWVSTMNNLWGLDVMVYMHELGHNLGLNHASLSESGGGDYSSYMSATGWKPNLEGPKKCFNAASTRQMNWFQDRTKVIDAERDPAVKITLAAFSEFEKPEDADPVLIEVGSYSVQYNFASEFNSGTEILRNVVTVAWGNPGRTTVEKDGLFPGGTVFEVGNFDGTGQTLRIEACKKLDGDGQMPNSMDIAITLGRAGSPCAIPDDATPATPETTPRPTPQPTPNPTATPTESPTRSPTRKPTDAPISSPPTQKPTTSPTDIPTKPTPRPTPQPTPNPTATPTESPTRSPTRKPTDAPISSTPTHVPISSTPTQKPTTSPTSIPTKTPTRAPISSPTESPTTSLVEEGKPVCEDSSRRKFQFTNGRGRTKTKSCNWIAVRFNRRKGKCNRRNELSSNPGETVGHTCQQECAPVTDICRLNKDDQVPPGKPTPPGEDQEKPTCPMSAYRKFSFINGRGKSKTKRCSWISRRYRRRKGKCNRANANPSFPGETIGDVCATECAKVTDKCRLDENTDNRKPTCPDTSRLRFTVQRRRRVRSYRCKWLGRRNRRAKKFCRRNTADGDDVFSGGKQKIADICQQECAIVTRQCLPGA